MTADELLTWGSAEDKLRRDDLAGVCSPAGLDRAKDNAVTRRKAVGLTRGQASRAVRDAQYFKRHGNRRPT